MTQLKSIFSKFQHRLSILEMAREGNASNDSVWLYNFWNVRAEQFWLTRFMKHCGLIGIGKKFSIYTVFGDRQIVRYDKRDIKIFYTGENVHIPRYLPYSDNMLSEKNIDLSLGFDYLDDFRYLRIPLWVRTHFDPEWSEEEIANQVKKLRYPLIGDRTKFASLVARYDWNNTRSQIYDSLKKIDKIQCPSQVLHNDDSLKTYYHDNKEAYLRQFGFNICPENSNHTGYVTEKIFDSISAGCIPIYWGSDNRPEPDLLNHNAMILWDFEGDNSCNISIIEQLWKNKNELNEFMHQPRLNENAENVVLRYFKNLEKSLKSLC